MVYFLRNPRLFKFGFPRLSDGTKKEIRWKKMNFKTTIPKHQPLVNYLVATGIGQGQVCYRMHVVALYPGIENMKECSERGQDIMSVRNHILCCHLTKPHNKSLEMLKTSIKLRNTDSGEELHSSLSTEEAHIRQDNIASDREEDRADFDWWKTTLIPRSCPSTIGNINHSSFIHSQSTDVQHTKTPRAGKNKCLIPVKRNTPEKGKKRSKKEESPERIKGKYKREKSGVKGYLNRESNLCTNKGNLSCKSRVMIAGSTIIGVSLSSSPSTPNPSTPISKKHSKSGKRVGEGIGDIGDIGDISNIGNIYNICNIGNIYNIGRGGISMSPSESEERTNLHQTPPKKPQHRSKKAKEHIFTDTDHNSNNSNNNSSNSKNKKNKKNKKKNKSIYIYI